MEIQKVYLNQHGDWTISLDDVTDCSGNSILAVLLIHGTTKHYIGNWDLGSGEHLAVNLGGALID